MKKINKKKVLLLFVLSSFMIVLLFTISKLVSNKNNNYFIKIATPIIELSKRDEDINMTENKNEYSQRFDIMNYTNNKINEVKLKYYLEFIYVDIDSSKVEINLKRNNDIVNITDNRTSEFLLQNDIKQHDEFILNVKYIDETIRNDIIGKIKIKIHSYQS